MLSFNCVLNCPFLLITFCINNPRNNLVNLMGVKLHVFKMPFATKLRSIATLYIYCLLVSISVGLVFKINSLTNLQQSVKRSYFILCADHMCDDIYVIYNRGILYESNKTFAYLLSSFLTNY